MSGAATAALAELHPRGARRQAALIASVATAGGTALGPLLAGILAQYEPWPAVLPFVVHLILFVPGVLALLFIPESVHAKSTGVWRPQRPGVPTEIRPSFVIGSATAMAPRERRGDVISSFYVVIYCGVGIPILGVGFGAAVFGLYHAVLVFACLYVFLVYCWWLSSPQIASWFRLHRLTE